ncbi:MAG: hypothetical protein JSV17_13720 [Candidatus Aminicenantes bacterium]|nr:MAG: hypothetical protein JSV17_13720 [Candidatus Aminicenantes bacterium]
MCEPRVTVHSEESDTDIDSRIIIPHQGRILEVSRDNMVVWEYVSPYRAGKNNELIATVMSAIRVNPEKLTFIKH